MCEILVTCRDRKSINHGYDFECTGKESATATSKELHTIGGGFVKMRICSRHATMYEKKYKDYWNVERDT